MFVPILRRAAARVLPFLRRPNLPIARVRLAVLAALVLAVGAGACSEQLDSGATCTTLCPLANAQLRDTVLDPVAFDTSVNGFPQLGATRPLLLAVEPAPDTADVRALVRFDSIYSKYKPAAGGDSVAITTVDSTYLIIRFDTLVGRPSQAVTIEAYDVDTANGVDTVSAVLATLFRPDRFLGSYSLAPSVAIPDSARIKLSDSAFAAKARAGARFRVGLRVVSAGRAQLRVLGARSGLAIATTGPRLSFDVATDTGYHPVTISPSSTTPGASNDVVTAALVDQSIVVRPVGSAPNGDLVVGGAPGYRSLIRFNIPTGLTDSTDIVRAVLELTQRPAPGLSPLDTVSFRSEGVLATTAITDVRDVLSLTAPSGFSLDTLRISPADSGTRSLSLVTLVRSWRSLPANTQRAIALRAPLEGAQLGQLRFFSASAPAAVRPRLRLTYIPRTSFGIP